MRVVRTISAVAAVVAAVATSSASFAGPGPGPCTSSGNSAVGVEGPAMNSGQLAAGVGNCRYYRHGGWRNSYGYYREPARVYRGYYDRGYGYGYDEPGVTIGVGPDRW